MKKRQIALVGCSLALLAATGLAFARGGRPAPPPPVRCGCLCPDGSFTTTHAPDADSSPSACEQACQGSDLF